MIDCVVAPLDHMFSVAIEDVNTTESPVQNVVGPLELIIGTTGVGITITTIGDEVAIQFPVPVVTVYEPL